MDIPTSQKSCLIIGAGICGLSAARALFEAGWQVTVIERSPGVGGRMATRRIGSGVFDHGAQFFTVRSEEFAKIVNGWVEAGVATEWCRGFFTEDGAPASTGHLRYRGEPCMTAIPKWLAKDLDVRTGTQATAIYSIDQGWEIELKEGPALTANTVLLTPPIPQAIELLDTGNVHVENRHHRTLDAVSYQSCLAVMAVLDRAPEIPVPGAVQQIAEPVTWISDNQQKGISPEAFAVTLHGGPNFTSTYWDASDQVIADRLFKASRQWLKDAEILSYEVKRWRYSRPSGLLSILYLTISNDPTLILAGDAFGGPRIEGAVTSGLAAAKALMKKHTG